MEIFIFELRGIFFWTMANLLFCIMETLLFFRPWSLIFYITAIFIKYTMVVSFLGNMAIQLSLPWQFFTLAHGNFVHTQLS